MKSGEERLSSQNPVTDKRTGLGNYWEPADPHRCPIVWWRSFLGATGGKETTMGIDVGAKGSSMATMNVVPLIDILLVLIIIFMVITPLTPKGLHALVPQPAPPNQQQQPQPI